MSEQKALPDYSSHFVWWTELTYASAADFLAAIGRAKNERAVQKYLEMNPSVLLAPFGGGKGRWVIPQARIGSHYVTDFLIADVDDLGARWLAVELESPHASPATKSGAPSAELHHAITQIEDWRRWIGNNPDQARRPKSQDGLGFEGINQETPGLIIIGRRTDLTPKAAERIKQLSHAHRIEIQTYDWLYARAAGRAEAILRDEQPERRIASQGRDKRLRRLLDKLMLAKGDAAVAEAKLSLLSRAQEGTLELAQTFVVRQLAGYFDHYWLTVLALNTRLQLSEQDLVRWTRNYFFSPSASSLSEVDHAIGQLLDQLASNINSAETNAFLASQGPATAAVIERLEGKISAAGFSRLFQREIRSRSTAIRQWSRALLAEMVEDSCQRVLSTMHLRIKTRARTAHRKLNRSPNAP